MKKLLSILLSLSLLCAFAGCSNTNDNETSENEGTNDTTSNVIETDVVVVGAGGAGLSAAINAAYEGASVVLLEKTAAVGGSTLYSGGAMTRPATTEEVQEGYYTEEELVQKWYDTTQGNGDLSLIKKIGSMASETIKWVESLGIPYYKAATTYEGSGFILFAPTVSDTGALSFMGAQPLIDGFVAEAEKQGVTTYLSTAATALTVNEQGEVNGVVAVDAEGNEIRYSAKSVVLATGGFTNNLEIIKENNETLYNILIDNNIMVTGGAGSTGDAIAMATEVGADTLFEGDLCNGGGYQTAVFNAYNPAPLFVTEEGTRFVDENTFYGLLYRALMNNIEAGHKSYVIADANHSGEACETAVSEGKMVKADTLEELATLIGIDPEGLKETVANYNELCENGEDTEFGKPSRLLTALETGPYYAAEVLPYVLGTFGGLYINEEAQIMGTDGNPIVNLYGAGDCANAKFFYNDYPYSGTCVQFAITSGRIAGTNAAKNAK